ncbi:MAG: LPS-assembly protein LptD [Proteobacteria bacterium]|nr:LPS-assembly protein LptD [Pseudomonadota bacterium]
MFKKILFSCLLLSLFVSAHAIPSRPNVTEIEQCGLVTDAEKRAIPKIQLTTSQIIGWVDSPSAPTSSCHGHYEEPLLSIDEKELPQNGTRIQASGQTSLYASGCSTFEGPVVIQQPNKLLTADFAKVFRDAKTQKITQIMLYGHVTLREPGKLLYGDKATLYPTTKTGIIEKTTYRIAMSDLSPPQEQIVSLYGMNAWGEAKTAKQDKEGDYHFEQGTYSTCPPGHNDWRIAASKVVIHKKTRRGEAYHMKLRVKDIPVFYFPYFNFPIDDRRQTGFLVPYYKQSSRSGTILGAPFYWNLAPNYDLTLTPEWYSKRGFMMNGDFRYLTKNSSGRISGNFLPADQAYKTFKQNNNIVNHSINRGLLHVDNTTQFNSHWSSNFIFNRASDDYYFEDFGESLATNTQTQLVREANLKYTDTHWDVLSRVQSFQTLHPIDIPPVNGVYERLPQLLAVGRYPQILPGTNFTFSSEYDYFGWSNQQVGNPVGNRINLSPSFDFPFERSWGYFTPQAQLSSTQYYLNNQPTGFSDNLQRHLPILSAGAGLYFDRHFSWFDRAYQHTLEPKLYYLYVPFQNQSAFPNFDSTYYIFTFDQLFRNNRFTGNDRLGDANQMSLALLSRVIDETTGAEKFRIGIGQIMYFQNRRVTLTPNDQGLIGFTPRNTATSPLVGQIGYMLSPEWYANADGAWDFQKNRAENSQISLHFSPEKTRVFHLSYSFLRNGDTPFMTTGNTNLHQIHVGLAHRLTPQWNMLLGAGYNISHNHPLNYLFGVEYDTCCWAVRTVVTRTFDRLNASSQPQYENRIVLQILLKGFGTLATQDSTGAIRESIPGYQDSFKG